MLAWHGKKTREARRRKILNDRYPGGRRKSLAQTMLERATDDLEATADRIKFYGQRAYMELVNLCFEQRAIPLRPGEQIRVHFLHAVPSYWPSWRSFYEACRADTRFAATVILLDCEGTFLENPQRLGARTSLEEMDMAYREYADYDQVKEKPHLIFYTAPYNYYYEYFRKVSPDLVKTAGIRPTYCSYGIEYDASHNMGLLNSMHYHHYAQALAWRSFVMHDDIREGYFQFCRTGGSHVVPSGHPKFDTYGVLPDQLPKEIEEKRNDRKCLVFQVHHPNNHDCRYKYRTHHLPTREIVSILQYLAEQEKVFGIISLHPLFSSWSVRSGDIAPMELERLKARLERSPNTALYQGDYQALLPLADAFISGQSSLLLEMAFQNKPVLYLYDEPLALKPYVAEIFRSFYQGRGYGYGLADVRAFLTCLEEGDDPLAGIRRKVWEKYFSGYAGETGLHMKEHILHALLETYHV